jgi:hypothetical protein
MSDEKISWSWPFIVAFQLCMTSQKNRANCHLCVTLLTTHLNLNIDPLAEMMVAPFQITASGLCRDACEAFFYHVKHTFAPWRRFFDIVIHITQTEHFYCSISFEGRWRVQTKSFVSNFFGPVTKAPLVTTLAKASEFGKKLLILIRLACQAVLFLK